jgi:ankyrin repeat protein
MKKRDYGRLLLITLLTLAVMAGGLSWLTWRETRQQRLNRALIAAILHADTPAALSLLDAGADPNTHLEPDSPRSAWQLLLDRVRGRRPPPNASDTALLMVMDSLVKQRDRRGLNAQGIPLENAVLVRALLDKGANVNARNEIGETALCQAAGWDYAETVQILLAHHADVNIPELGGGTALMSAAERGDTGIAEALLQEGADPDARNILGDTALMNAAAFDLQEGVVKALLEHHANVHLKNGKGQTALDIARKWNETNTIRMLREAGAK